MKKKAFIAALALTMAICAGCSSNSSSTSASSAQDSAASTASTASAEAASAEASVADTADTASADAASIADTVAAEASTQAEAETVADETTQGGLTDGIYVSTFTAEGRGEYYNFFHFYDNGLFYCSLYNGAQVTAGNYEVTDEPMDYTTQDDETITADKSIKMTKLDGSDYTTVAYDTNLDQLGDVSVLYSLEFQHDLNPDPDKSAETGVTIETYQLPDDDYSLVEIKHNGTYSDTIGALIEGTWEKDGNVYTLTDGDSGDSYTMTLSDDGNTADYIGPDGTEQTLNAVKEAKPVVVFSGSTDEAAYGTMDAKLNCYEDGTAKLVVEYAGSEQQLDATWKLADDNSSMAITIDGTDYTAPINPDDHTFTLDVTLSDGIGDVTFSLSTPAA